MFSLAQEELWKLVNYSVGGGGSAEQLALRYLLCPEMRAECALPGEQMRLYV